MSLTRLAPKGFAVVAVTLAALHVPGTRADGDPAPTYQRERAVQKYKNCHWTNEMGQYVYQCIKKNDGLNAHWCYDEALEVLCPAQVEADKKSAVESSPVAKPDH